MNSARCEENTEISNLEATTSSSSNNSSFNSYSYTSSYSFRGYSFESRRYYRYREEETQRIKYIPLNRRWNFTKFGNELSTLKDNFYSNKNRNANYASNEMNCKKLEYAPFEFKLATYNLLAPNLLEDNFYLYKDTNRTYLDWNYRKYRILNEIKRINADIYCFQEMSHNDFNDFFKLKLNKLGYNCYYKKRYGDSKQDGCAIAFRNKRFTLVKEQPVDFFVPNVEILNRENVGLILLLESKFLDRNKQPIHLCVATTHILFNPRRGDCKLAQLQLLLANIDRVSFDKLKLINNKLTPIYHPTILCGDFNAVHTSKIYEFLTQSKLADYKNLNRYILSGQSSNRNNNCVYIQNCLLPESLGISDQSQFKQDINERKNLCVTMCKNKTDTDDSLFNCTYNKQDLEHPFCFKSAYEHVNSYGQSEVTMCVSQSKINVDYIFYHTNQNSKLEKEENEDEVNPQDSGSDSENAQKKEYLHELNLVARLELFGSEFLKDCSIPDKNYGSDHFLLAAKFAIL